MLVSLLSFLALVLAADVYRSMRHGYALRLHRIKDSSFGIRPKVARDMLCKCSMIKSRDLCIKLRWCTAPSAKAPATTKPP